MQITVSHSLSMTTPDDPAYENKPSDWNKAHLVTVGSFANSDLIKWVSAGTTSMSSGTLQFSNGSNVSFGLNGGTITASVASSLTNVNVSAGTTSNNISNFVFSNSNGVSFGLNGSTITGSVATSLTNIKFSAGTTSNNLSAITFSNSNGVSFGLNGSTVTGSVATSLTNINISGGTTSNNLSAITFSNSNGVSFGLNGSTLTGSVATSLTNINASAGTTSNNLSAIVFSNSNGVSFGLNGSTITGSVAAGGGSPNFSAGTTSNNLNSVVFSNSNGVSFGLNGSTITGSVATSLTNINISAGTTSGNLSNWVYSNSNNISFGLNGSTVTGSVAAPISVGMSNLGNTFGSSGTVSGLMVFAGTGGIQLSQSTNGASATLSFGEKPKSFWEPVVGAMSGESNWLDGANGAQAYISRYDLPFDLTASAFNYQQDFAVALTTVGAFSITQGFTQSLGVYTRATDSTSKFLTYFSTTITGSMVQRSNSGTWAWAGSSLTTSGASTSVSNASFAGIRLCSIPFATSMSAGEYLFAIAGSSSLSTSGSNSRILSLNQRYVLTGGLGNGQAYPLAASNASIGFPNPGGMRFSVNGIPATHAISGINYNAGGGFLMYFNIQNYPQP